MQENKELEYAGFWIRVWASIIDGTLWLIIIIMPILLAVYGTQYLELMKVRGPIFQGPIDFLINGILPAIVVITFWIYRSATPGKIISSLRIVDAKTGEQPTVEQFIGRYLAYIVASLPLGLGIIWVAFDKRKQGWHDKLAGTIVVQNKKNS